MEETESTITKITEDESHETNYQIDDISSSSLTLTSCVILDMVDGKIQCCSKISANQRLLTQLVGIWEIDGNIFTNMKVENKLHTLGVCSSHYNFDQNALHKPNLNKNN